MHSGGWWRYISYDESKGKPQVDRDLLWRVYGYAKPHRFSVAMVLVTILLVSLLELIPPLLYRDLIDNVLIDNGLANGSLTRLNWLAVGMLAIPVVRGFVGVGRRYFSSKAGEGIIYDLRAEMYRHLQ